MSNLKEMSEGLLRQRRNYIIVSCILIFLVFSQVKIEALSLLGIKFSDFNNPEAVYVALWVSYIYLTIRYTQYFGREGYYRLQKAYVGTFSNNVSNYAYKQVARTFPYTSGLSYEPLDYKDMSKKKWVINATLEGVRTEKVQLNFFKICRIYIYSFLNVTFKQVVFWDYVVPFVIGLMALIYCFSGSEATLVSAIKVIFA